MRSGRGFPDRVRLAPQTERVPPPDRWTCSVPERSRSPGVPTAMACRHQYDRRTATSQIRSRLVDTHDSAAPNLASLKEKIKTKRIKIFV